MRLGDYVGAATYFLRAHRIDSQRAALRLAMFDLRMILATRPLKKRSREEAFDLQRRAAMTISPHALDVSNHFKR